MTAFSEPLSIMIEPNQYKNISFKRFSKIHQITAYLAMFPPSLPNYFIKNFSMILKLLLPLDTKTKVICRVS